MRYLDTDRNTNLYRCDRCGRDGLSSIINSQNVDHCLECWIIINNIKVDAVREEPSLILEGSGRITTLNP